MSGIGDQRGRGSRRIITDSRDWTAKEVFEFFWRWWWNDGHLIVRLRNMFSDEVGELVHRLPMSSDAYHRLVDPASEADFVVMAAVLTELGVPRPPASWREDANL